MSLIFSFTDSASDFLGDEFSRIATPSLNGADVSRGDKVVLRCKDSGKTKIFVCVDRILDCSVDPVAIHISLDLPSTENPKD